MTQHYLLDTNICIYIAKHHPLQVRKRFEELQTGEVGMSFVTHGELMFGAEKSQYRHQTIEKLTRLIEIIPVVFAEPQIAEHYGEIRAILERSGKPIGANDLWIAAHARSLGMTLVSNNIKEFERVPKLMLENWL
ncbi:MAG: type II toxin-antitoxin system VapC family toxin [Mariprofundaceae bacterium]|nr:type II toxin-antitoxin system VapC family toxin [Mariprofundaceae bacterium]